MEANILGLTSENVNNLYDIRGEFDKLYAKVEDLELRNANLVNDLSEAIEGSKTYCPYCFCNSCCNIDREIDGR